MTPHFEDIQAHYDLSDDFFGVFQDPTRKYSCAYFTGPNVTLSEAQVADVDLNLDKLDLKPGMTLLEIGCGWGLTLQRAMERYDVNVIGLTLSKNQKAYCDQLLAGIKSDRTFEVRLEGWEQFHQPVDRIVSIEAFEHFGFERYDDYFKNCFDILPDDGRMTIQSSVGYHPYDLPDHESQPQIKWVYEWQDSQFYGMLLHQWRTTAPWMGRSWTEYKAHLLQTEGIMLMSTEEYNNASIYTPW